MVKILGLPLRPIPRDILAEIMAKSGVESCIVTSIERTPQMQARIMYENVRLHGLQSQYNLYGPFGDQVLDIYKNNQLMPKDQVIQLMTAKIVELGPQNVSHHCAMDRYVFDVAPDSILKSLQDGFLKAAQEHPKVIKLLSPLTVPIDPAFHIEIMKEEV